MPLRTIRPPAVTALALLIASEPSGVVPPTAAAKLTGPAVAASPRLWAPSKAASKSIRVPLRAVAPTSVTASRKVCEPDVASAPLSVVEPPPVVARSRMPVKLLPGIAVTPLKSRVRSLPPPATPPPKVGVVPVSVVLVPSVTSPP